MTAAAYLAYRHWNVNGKKKTPYAHSGSCNGAEVNASIHSLPQVNCTPRLQQQLRTHTYEQSLNRIIFLQFFFLSCICVCWRAIRNSFFFFFFVLLRRCMGTHTRFVLIHKSAVKPKIQVTTPRHGRGFLRFSPQTVFAAWFLPVFRERDFSNFHKFSTVKAVTTGLCGLQHYWFFASGYSYILRTDILFLRYPPQNRVPETTFKTVKLQHLFFFFQRINLQIRIDLKY